MFGKMEMILIIPLLVLIAIIALVIFIQVKLSRSENKFLGLILPIISFLLSISLAIGIASFAPATSTSSVTVEYMEDGEIGTVYEEEEEVVESGEQGGAYIGMFLVFLTANIPTVILGGIYMGERNKINTKKSIDKMKIEDL